VSKAERDLESRRGSRVGLALMLGLWLLAAGVIGAAFYHRLTWTNAESLSALFCVLVTLSAYASAGHVMPKRSAEEA
jgi:hypothetical protein